jgi:O-antigen ligase
MLYWSVPLRFGGTPFASYVNRNHAAGYFNLCLAAGLGWFLFQYGSRLIHPVAGDVRPRSRLPWKVRILRAVAAIDGAELALLGLLSVTAAAVLFSLSRGGILALIVGLGVTLWWYRGLSRTAATSVVLLLAAGAVGMILWVDGWGVVEERLTSLGDTAKAAEGRLVHWWDTSAAVRDFPLLGTGLGTYRYANLPYQRHQGHAWYVNADNHYFEMLVETGVIGLALFVGGFVLTGLAAGFLARSEHPELRAVGLTGLFAVTAQAVQATTDFGLLIPANALTFAVIAGAVCGTACMAAGFDRIRLPMWLSIARL